MSSNNSVQAVYNKAAQNAVLNSRQVQEIAEMAARMLLGKDISALAAEDQRQLRMAATAAVSSFGSMLGTSDAGAEFGMLYQGLAGSSRVAARRNVGGRLTGPTLSMKAHDPVNIVAAAQTQRMVDEYVNGKADDLTPGARADGLTSGVAAGFTAQWLKSRGGIKADEMRQYEHDGSLGSMMKMRRSMSRNANMSKEEQSKVDTDIMTSHYLELMAQSRKQMSYNELSLQEQEEIRAEARKLSTMDSKQQQAEHDATLRSIEEQYYRQIKQENPSMSDKDARARARSQVSEMRRSGAIDVSEEGLASAERALEGRSNYTATTKQFKNSVEDALDGAKRTLAEMTDIFGTDSFEELEAIAKQFGVATLTSAEGARKMRDIMASAKARAASTGRTVQEVMEEYQAVGAQGAAIYGGEGFVPASYFRGYNNRRSATARNRESGVDRRSDEEIDAEYNAMRANEIAHYTDVVVAIDLSERNGDGKMAKWKRRLEEQNSGGRPLSDGEINAMKADAQDYLQNNASHMTADQKAAMFADSSTTDLITGFENKDRDGSAERITHSMIRQWNRSGENSVQFRELLSDTGGLSHLGSRQERANALAAAMQGAIHEYGGDVGAMQDFLREGGEMDAGIKRHNGDIEAYIKEDAENMRKAGASEADIKARADMIRTTARLTGRARSTFLDSIEVMQRDNKIINTRGSHQQREDAAREAAALEQESRDKTRGVAANAARGDFLAYLSPENTTEAAAVASMYTVGRGENGGDTLFVDADNNLQQANINAAARMTDEELTQRFGANSKRAQAMAGNSFAFSKGENGGYSLAKAQEDVDKNLAAMAEVEAILADPNATPEQKEAATRRKQALQGQQEAFRKATGISMADFRSQAEQRGLTDTSFHALVQQQTYKNSGTMLADDSGNAVVLADDRRQSAVNTEIAEAKQIEMLQAMDASALTALGFTETDQADLQLLKDPKTSEGQRREITSRLRSRMSKNKSYQEMIRGVSQAGLELHMVDNLDEHGNADPTRGKRLQARTSTGEVAFDLGTREGILDMRFEALKQGGPEAMQGLVQQAQAGDKDALAILNRQGAKQFGYLNGSQGGYMGFNYAEAYKAMVQSGLAADGAEDDIREKQRQFEALGQKFARGEGTVEDRQEALRLQRELDRLTKGARTAGAGSAQQAALLNYAGGDAAAADRMFRVSQAQLAEQAAITLPGEEAEQAAEDAEQTRDMTTKVITLCESLLKTITGDGKIKVKEGW